MARDDKVYGVLSCEVWSEASTDDGLYEHTVGESLACS